MGKKLRTQPVENKLFLLTSDLREARDLFCFTHREIYGLLIDNKKFESHNFASWIILA